MDHSEKKITQKQPYSENFGRLIGTSKPIQQIHKKIKAISSHSSHVFITGESGTGKELCAQAIHYYSERSDYNFVPINCASIPENLFETTLFGHVKGAFTSADYDRQGAIDQAQNGTLFLDEITEMPIEMQAKLLRFSQDQTFQKVGSDTQEKANIRIICTSNRNVEIAIKEGKFRKDLFYRLHILPITMPSLRERSQDILDIADYFLHQYSKSYQKSFKFFSKTVENIFQNYNWPGNVRELKNIIEQIVVMNDANYVLVNMLPNTLTKNSALYENEEISSVLENTTIPLWKIEKNAIQSTINLCRGNITKAASLLEVSPSTIYRKIQNWNEN